METNTRKYRTLGLFVFVTLSVSLLFGSTILKYPQVDVQDESIYLDHLIKASDFQMGQAGDYYSEKSIREICWRGGQVDHPVVPFSFDGLCNAEDQKLEFGPNYSTPMPMYFLATGVTARVVTEIFDGVGIEQISVVTLGRFLGITWFLIAILFVYKSVRLFTPNAKLVAPLAIGIASLPSIFHEHTIINADASSFAFGSAVIFFTLRHAIKQRSIWQIFVSVIFALLATSHNLVGIGTATLFLFFLLIMEQLRKSKKVRTNQGLSSSYFVLVSGLVALSLIFSLVWQRLVFRIIRPWIYGLPDVDPSQIGSELKAMYASSGIRWYAIFSPENITRFIVPGSDNFQPLQRFGGPYNSAVWFFGLLLVTGLFSAILTDHNFEKLKYLSAAHLLSSILFPILFVLHWNLQGVHDGVLGRFGLSSLVVPVITTAVLFEGRRFSHTIIWGLSICAFVAALLTNFVSWV